MTLNTTNICPKPRQLNGPWYNTWHTSYNKQFEAPGLVFECIKAFHKNNKHPDEGARR